VKAFLLNILTGLNTDEFDSGRVLWVFGSSAYVLSAIVFQAIALIEGQPFDPAAFCGGFGGGFAVVLGAGGYAIAKKDTSTAAVQQGTSE